jgi:sugar phosphate isomerase/epimerase
MRELVEQGYTGFEFPIAPSFTGDFAADVEAYRDLRTFLDSEGFEHVALATNVGATKNYDPSSPYPEAREKALQYLKSRIQITAALRGSIMMGPDIVPYGQFPTSDFGEPLWSDALQDWLEERYQNAHKIYHQLGEFAESMRVKVALEPITHWETPGPNTLSQMINFLENVESPFIGVVIDSAHEVLDGDGPEVFKQQVAKLHEMGRLHYVQLSAPDRGAIATSWVPWTSFLETILPVYDGPLAIETFNAIPQFASGLRLSRRKYWIPGKDEPVPHQPSAYAVARDSIALVKQKVSALSLSR